MKYRRILVVFVCLLTVFTWMILAFSSTADRVVLSNGREFEGIVKEKEQGVEITIASGGKVTVPRSMVKKIVAESPTPTFPPPSTETPEPVPTITPFPTVALPRPEAEGIVFDATRVAEAFRRSARATATSRAAWVPTVSNRVESTGSSTEVYVTKTGKKYHRAGCFFLKSQSAISLMDAKARGYTPCSKCDPPR